MRADTTLYPDPVDRKENLFLPSFPQKSRQCSRYSKLSKNSQDFNPRPLMSPEQVKILYEQIGPQNQSFIPQIHKPVYKQTKIKLRNFKFTSTPPINKQKFFFISKLFHKQDKNSTGEDYKFMLTGANFTYLNNRILEKDSSVNTIVHELPSLDARYKHMSPEPRDVIFKRSSKGFSDYFKSKTIKY